LLEQQPLMTLFLTIAIGYLVGEINIKGFSLGVGAVLFVALAVGWFAPKSVPAPMVERWVSRSSSTAWASSTASSFSSD
jgi:putative transport protein